MNAYYPVAVLEDFDEPSAFLDLDGVERHADEDTQRLVDDLLQILLGPFGTLVLSLLILFGGWKRWWVFGWHYSEVAKERDEWKEAALRGTKIAEAVTSVLPTVLRDNGGTS